MSLYDLACISCGTEDDRTAKGHLWCLECYLDAEELFAFNPAVRPADDYPSWGD